MAIDTNTWLDASKLLVQEHEQAKQIIGRQGAEIKQLRADLEAAKKATATANELADQMKASLQGQQIRFSEQAKRISELTDEAAKHKSECQDLRKRFDPELKAAELAEKAKHLERLKSEATRLEAELKA